MGTTDEQLRAHWRADLARIATRIDDLKARIDTESRMLYANLSAEVTALQSDLERLETEVGAVGADARARQIALQIEDLSAKGDAAYQLLQAGMAGHLDPIEAEMRRLEAVAATSSDDVRAKINARIEKMRSARAATQANMHADMHADGRAGQSGDAMC